MASPKEAGYRFYHLGGDQYGWRHYLEVKQYVADCTDMTDEQFESYVTSQPSSPQPQGSG